MPTAPAAAKAWIRDLLQTDSPVITAPKACAPIPVPACAKQVQCSNILKSCSKCSRFVQSCFNTMSHECQNVPKKPMVSSVTSSTHVFNVLPVVFLRCPVAGRVGARCELCAQDTARNRTTKSQMRWFQKGKVKSSP